jgi:hypothetical protein
MTGRRLDCRRLTPVVAAAWLSACQPLPHPFADDRPPADLIKMRSVASVSVAPVAGEPAATAARLASAIAGALLQREIPASDKTTSLGSYLLYGRVVEAPARDGRATLTALWRLYGADGRQIGERSAKAEARPLDWATGSAPPVEQLAQRSADALAPLLEDEAPKSAVAADPDAGRVRVAVHAVKGAPGDGAQSLANAVAGVLKFRKLAIVADGQAADLYVDGEVAIAPARGDQQHVKIVWRVRRADGSEIGNVGMENDVPRGALDKAWGDIAFSVAVAAGDGLMQLVARGAPARQP